MTRPNYIPDQIEELNIPSNPDNLPCFVYEWYNINLDKYYVGYHKHHTPLEDAYYHSSTDIDFKKDFLNDNYKWRYTVKEYGSQTLMMSLENKILVDVNAKDNPKWYNKTNGIPQELSLPDFDLIDDFVNQILENKCFDEITPVQWTKEDLSNLTPYQARGFTLDGDHENNIKNKIDDSNGEYAKKELLLTVFKNRKWLGKVVDLLVNGNHSQNGFIKSKTGVTISVLVIPEEKHRHLSDEEVKIVAARLNPVSKTPRKETQPEDLVKLIYELNLKGITNRSQTVQKLLDSFNLTSKKRRRILNDVNKMTAEKTSQVNQLWIMYNAGQEEQDLKDRLEKENREPGTYCKSFNTKVNDFWKSLHMIREINEETPGRIKMFKCLFWHPSKQVEKNWFEKDMVKNKTRLEYYLNRNGDDKDGVEVVFEYLPTTRSSTLDNGNDL